MKKAGLDNINTVKTNFTAVKNKAANGSDMSIDTELGRFSGDSFLPEKHKEDEVRLSNSML